MEIELIDEKQTELYQNINHSFDTFNEIFKTKLKIYLENNLT